MQQMVNRASCVLCHYYPVIRVTGAAAFIFLMGMAIGNYHATKDAMAGQAKYFVYNYAPKLAAKAAGGAVKSVEKNCPASTD